MANVEYIAPKLITKSNLVFTFSKNTKGLKLYYRKTKSDPKQKLIFKTPKMMSHHGLVMNKNGSGNLMLSTIPFSDDLEEEVATLVSMIEKVQIAARKTVDSKLIHKKYPLADNVKSPGDIIVCGSTGECDILIGIKSTKDHPIGLFGENREPASIDEFRNKCLLSCVIQLSGIIFSVDGTRYYFDWDVLQVRKHKIISRVRSLFVNRCVLDDVNDSHLEEVAPSFSKKDPMAMIMASRRAAPSPAGVPPPPPSAPSPPSRPTNTTGFVPPTQKQITDMLQKLKKVPSLPNKTGDKTSDPDKKDSNKKSKKTNVPVEDDCEDSESEELVTKARKKKRKRKRNFD